MITYDLDTSTFSTKVKEIRQKYENMGGGGSPTGSIGFFEKISSVAYGERLYL